MVIVAVVLAFVVGVGFVLGGAKFASNVPAMMMRRKLDTRLKEIAIGDRPDSEPAKALLKSLHEGPLPALDRAFGDTARGHAFAEWIAQSGTKASVSAVLLTAAIAGVIIAFATAIFSRAPLSMLGGFAVGASLPFLVLRIKRGRRLHAFEEQFPEALDLIGRALKAGHAFATGMKMVADEMPEPVGPEFRKSFDEQNFGLPLKDALENLTMRIPLLDVRFFATAVLIQRETGGNLAEILDNLAHVVRERFKILRQVRVYTAHGRLTGYVLLALPAFLSVALMFINPEHMNLLFRERMGQMMLMAAIVMQTFGFLWIKKIVKIEV
ncbi:MAG TPA: type II secretion system F family protein [Vicinamibacterales bacterium]|nr:type II secretion system F family protein [Vicinamibacterales bacterium]